MSDDYGMIDAEFAKAMAKLVNTPDEMTLLGPSMGLAKRRLTPPDGFWVKLTGKSSTTPATYSWTRVKRGSAGWEETDPEITGSDNAIETHGNDVAWDEETDFVVWIRMLYQTTDGVTNVFGFEYGGGGLPIPTAQYQVLQCTSYTDSTTYTVAFDWVRAHS
jgi:hypothetical protein